MPGYFTPAEIVDAKIEQDLKDQRKVKEDKIIAIIACPNGILHADINTKGIYRFNE